MVSPRPWSAEIPRPEVEHWSRAGRVSSTTGEANTVHDVAQLFARRGNEFSVYSIDWEQEVVVLIRPAEGVDLKAHPFFREVSISGVAVA
ncbi:Hypp3832 [Branchiostoma lanceolatum]|uniref:Hypp3832 protein n=1 Tax=Branchiostoma lanceolatum TaxID=7740 RepID=A0A8K0EZC4_BRALA|nr:Hypp3832 [Branchiostoma lanceolatum]